jgi:hypothetical protein
MRCEVRSYSSARCAASFSRPAEASACGADREDFPSEAGGTDETFTRSTLSQSVVRAQESGGNTLLILEIVVMGASLAVA